VAVERLQRSRVGRRGPEADVAIWSDQDHAARRDAGSDGIEVRVVRDPHEPGPALAQLRERCGVCGRSKHEHVVRRPAELRSVRVALLPDEPSVHAVAGELGGSEQPGGACTDNQDVIS
jgi:hypothetical protein